MLSYLPDHELLDLVRKSLAGTSTPEEEALLAGYYKHLERRPDIIAQMSAEEKAVLEYQMKTAILQRLDGTALPKLVPMKRLRWRSMVAAAAILVFIFSVSYFIITRSKDSQSNSVEKQPLSQTNDVLPGGNKATLTLEDGSIIVLDSAKNGRVADQGSTTILKVSDGQLAYNTVNNIPEILSYNTVSTPRGGQYQLVLPDGTKVWLNAASSIRFPTAFGKGERRVEVQGEAYFEVVHNEQQAFIVQANNIQVHDLGTAFNVNAYPDEPSLSVTLVNGLANVISKHQTLQLLPGFQAQTSGDETKVYPVDIDVVTAWKAGKFQFMQSNIESVMRQIARWYNIDVEYNGSIENRFNGSIYRDSKASEVFRILEENGKVRFDIKGGKVWVSPVN